MEKRLFDTARIVTEPVPFVVVGSLAFVAGFLLQNVGLFLPDHLLNDPDNRWIVIDAMVEWIHYDYGQLGFARRAFVGTTLAWIDGADARYAAYVAISLAIVGFLLAFLFRNLERIRTDGVLAAFGIVFVLAPIGAQNVGWMFGRFDWINLSLLVAIVAAIGRGHVLAASLLLCVTLLIHEAALFYVVPVAAASLWVGARDADEAMRRTITLLTVPAFLALLLALFGNSDAQAMGSHRSLFQYKGVGVGTALPVVYVSVLVAVIYQVHLQAHRLTGRLYAYAPYATFALFPLGIDYPRWATLFFFSAFAMALVIDRAPGLARHDVGPSASRRVRVCALLLVLPQLGPFGVDYAYPVLEDLMTLVSKLRS